jgi:iron complex outermembrane receptor protein
MERFSPVREGWRMRFIRSFIPAVTGMLLAAGGIGAQGTGTVVGRALDAATLAPVSGAVVSVADRSGLSADDGRFLVTAVPAGTHTIRVSRLGYAEASQEVTVAAGQTVTVELRMTSEAIGLGEFVVTGYGQRREADVTGVIEAISAEEFNTGRVISAEQLIQGKVAGVDVIDSGEPGGGVSIRIRGGTSITSSNEPLFVVDGVPLAVGGGISAGPRNPLNFLNPNDIMSVTVLKDASATAIYGSRGANGVVMIETRTGRDVVGGEGSRLSYAGTVSGSFVSGEPEVLTAEQFRAAVADKASDGLALLGSENTDWRDAIQRTGVGQEHSVTLAGVTGDAEYRLSLGYLDQEGVVKGSATERATLGLSYNQAFVADQLRITANLTGSRSLDTFTPGGVIGGATAFAPTQPIFDESSPNGGFFEWYDYQQALNNPVAILELSTDEGSTYRSVGDVEARIEPTWAPGLSGTVRLGYDVTKAEREVFRPSILRGEFEGGNPGFVSRSNSTQNNVLLESFATYRRLLQDQSVDVEVTGGYTYEESNAEYPYFEARGLSFDLLGTNGVPTANEVRTTIDVQESRLISFFGRANLGLADRYLLSLSVRRDGSSRFGEAEQWGVFPSAAFAWRLSNESFFQDMEALSDLKLRFSWGVNGNQAFDNYRQYPAYELGEPTAQYQFGDDFVTTIRPGAADRDIKWEETTSWDVGLDFGFLDQRLSGALDYYYKKTEDLIFRVPVPAGTFTSNFITTNIGTLENRGFEITLDADVLPDGGDGGLSWTASFNASTNDNEIVTVNPFGGSEVILTGGIAGGVGSFIQVLRPGFPINSFFVYQHKRDASGKPISSDDILDMYVDQPTVPCSEGSTGLCPDGIINQDDKVPYESPAPNWMFGHTSLFRMGPVDASLTLRAQVGNYVYNNVASNNGHYRALAYVGAPNNLHASVLETGFESEQYFSDWYIEDGSFLRMDNVTLGYTFPTSPSGRQVRVFGTIQNAFTLTGYSGVDPLAGVNGIDNNLYPRSRTFTAGASVVF